MAAATSHRRLAPILEVHKEEAELREMLERREAKLRLKAERRRQQEENVERKRRQREAQR